MRINNYFLRQLASADQKRLGLKSLNIEHRRVLFEPGQNIDRVIFPNGAVISLVVLLSDGGAEVSTVGFDGMIGAAAAVDDGLSLNRAIVQMPGAAFECDADAFRAAALKNSGLLAQIIRHERALNVQTQQLAACHATHAIHARLCRWLLRARDLSGSDSLAVTQEYLSEMLGVRRTSITDVARELQEAGAISYVRGKLSILNVAMLRDHACECYGVVATHYRRMLRSQDHGSSSAP